MSTYAPDSIRSNIRDCDGVNNYVLGLLKNTFADRNNNDDYHWAPEEAEILRLERRYWRWRETMGPGRISDKYDSYEMADKKREFLMAMNKLFDALAVLWNEVDKAASGGRLEVRTISQLQEGLRALNGLADDFRSQWKEKFLRIASALYELERFDLGLNNDDVPNFQYPADDQEKEDLEREFYKQLKEGLIDGDDAEEEFERIRKMAVAPPPPAYPN